MILGSKNLLKGKPVIVGGDPLLLVDNKYEGEVLEVVYQGEFVEVLVCLKDGETILRANVDSRIHQRHRFAPGVSVQAGWNSNRSNILTA